LKGQNISLVACGTCIREVPASSAWWEFPKAVDFQITLKMKKTGEFHNRDSKIFKDCH